jgi:hypothetical protein
MRLSLFAIVALWAASIYAADPLPFDIQNGRNGLAFSAQSTGESLQWKRTIRIVVVGDAEQSLEKLTIQSPIVVETDAGDVSRLVPSSLPNGEKLQPGASQAIDISGELPKPGTYRGELVLVQGTRQRAVSIAISVAAPPPKTTPPNAPLVEHGGKAAAFGAGETPMLHLNLSNTGPEAVSVAPSFVAVSRVDKPDNETHEISVDSAEVTAAQQLIPPGDVKRFDVELPSIHEPGIYSVETLFSAANANYQTFSAKSTVYVRQSWMWAALFVALGALAAVGVRWHVTDGGKRLELRRRVSAIVERVRAFRGQSTNEATMQAARALELDLGDIARNARWGNKVTEIEADADVAEKRLVLLRDIDHALRELAEGELDQQASTRQVIDAALAAVRSPVTEEIIATHRKAIAELALETARWELLRKRSDELLAYVGFQRGTASPSFDRALKEIEASLSKRDGLLRSNRLDDLATIVATARSQLLDATAAELRRLVDGSAPLGVSDADWNTIVPQVRATLDKAHGLASQWSTRYAAVEEAQRIYFEAVIGGTVSAARAKARKGDSRATQLEKIASELESAMKADWKNAAQLYVRYLVVVFAADPSAIVEEKVNARLPASEVLTILAPLFIPPDVELKASEPTSTQLNRAVKSTSWVVNLVVFLIAIATGVRALWLDTLWWGGHSAWLLAFLWGAGFQIVGETFTGLVGLRAKLSGAPIT